MQRTHLIVVGEMVVGDCNSSRAHNSVHKAISAMGQRIVVDPNVTRPKYGNGVTVRHCPPTIMCGGASHHGIPCGFAVMDVKTVYYDICDILDCDAASISNVNIGSSPINGLEAVHDELLRQLDHHVTLEHNPERPVLDHSVAQSAGLGVHRVIVSGVSDHIEATITTTNCVPTEPNATVCKALPVTVPIGVTAPAIINGVTSSTREKSQISPFCAILDGPAISNTFFGHYTNSFTTHNTIS